MEMKDKNGLTEKEFLAQYKPSDFPRPSITVDIAIFTIMEGERELVTKKVESKLKLLLIKRGGHPFLGTFALPGGFVDKTETTEQAAKRELQEETGLNYPFLKQFNTFSNPNRDKRAWSITCAYMAMIRKEEAKVKASDDATEAKWFDVSLSCVRNDEKIEKDNIVQIKEYELILLERDNKLSARVQIIQNNHENRLEKEYKILNSEGIAFDHAEIITHAILKLRREIKYSETIFGVLPYHFTMKQMFDVYKVIIDEKVINKEIFMKEIEKNIEKVNESKDGIQLWKRKQRGNLEW